jgi:hypothetical protein
MSRELPQVLDIVGRRLANEVADRTFLLRLGSATNLLIAINCFTGDPPIEPLAA